VVRPAGGSGPPQANGDTQAFDLKREAAWNLAVIHLFAGSNAAARALIAEHCSV